MTHSELKSLKDFLVDSNHDIWDNDRRVEKTLVDILEIKDTNQIKSIIKAIREV